MRIEILQNGAVIETRDFKDGSYSIGREKTSQVQLISPQVSKAHALLVVKGGRAAIVDVGSANGVFVNGILIKKNRIDIGDEIAIGPFRLTLVSMVDRPQGQAESFQSSQSPKKGGEISFEGNVARKLDFSKHPEDVPQVSAPQERLLSLVDEKLLRPFYAIIGRYDWRWVLATIVGGALVMAVVLSAWPLLNWGRGILVAESLSRGQAILRQSVRENYRVLEKTNDFSRLTMELAEKEKGVLGAYIADASTRTLLAPAKFYNKPINDLYVIRAIEKLAGDDAGGVVEDDVVVERNDGTFILAQPIFQYAADGSRALTSVALLEFEIPNNLYTTFTPLAEMVMLALLLGLIAFYLIVKMMSYPLTRMLDQLDGALKGESSVVSAEIEFPELISLAQNINFALSRIKNSEGGALSPETNEASDEDEVLRRAVEAFDSTTADALLLMDTEKKVRLVGRVTEELLSMRSQYAIGQNISDACRDQAISGTAIDMAERVIQSLGEQQTADLEINGVSRSVSCVPIRNRSADIRFILLTVKMNG